MRKLSITFVLLIASIYAINAAILERKKIELEKGEIFDREERTLPYTPIDAFIENNNCILVSFLNEESQSVSFQIKDCHGAIIFQETITSNISIPYQINLDDFNPGKYQLIYFDEKHKITGSFLID